MVDKLTAASADGTDVRAIDEGEGRPILVVPPGLDDGTSWHGVATLLATQFRVVRVHRRQYRLDLSAKLPCSIRQEVEDLRALAGAIGEPAMIVGHSSGAVVALEALAAAPWAFAGGLLYEPPLHLRTGEWTRAVVRARAALAAGKPAKAMQVFNRDIGRLPWWTSRMIGAFAAANPRLREFIPHQIDDAAAINELGARLDTYAEIDVPTVLLGGDKGPGHLAKRLDALDTVMPRAERIVLPGQGHNANLGAPAALAEIIQSLGDKVFS